MDVLTGVMATTQMQSETRRDAFYNAVATQIAVKAMEASKAAVKAETRRVDSYDDVVEMMKDAAAASQARHKARKAFFARHNALKSFSARYKARNAFFAIYKDSIATFEAEAYDDEEDEAYDDEAYDDEEDEEEDEARAAVASQVRRYIAALEVRGSIL